jgi:type II secretory pathway component PulC
MGLRSGDLVLALNGQEITGPDQVPDFLQTIREGGEVDLMVRRRARTYRISLEIR